MQYVKSNIDNHSFGIERAEYSLNDSTRILWSSQEAKEVWQPRIQKIQDIWIKIEVNSVVEGLRSCALQFADPYEFVSLANDLMEVGLTALPLSIMGINNFIYSATAASTEGFEKGQPFGLRFVIGTQQNIYYFKKAWDEGDSAQIAELLGYPVCCAEFFESTWINNNFRDTTWPMAWITNFKQQNNNMITVNECFAVNNILWRWMGVRAVSHLPCRFDCKETEKIANRYLALGKGLGFEKEINTLLEILSWPIEWSALHGIVEIKTPILKISAMTDATAVKYTVRVPSENYPEEGALGKAFPYNKNKNTGSLTGSKFSTTMDNNKLLSHSNESWYAQDNGFSSCEEMDKMHAPIVDLAITVLTSNRGSTILDLGCGNGALLSKICRENSVIIPYGLDIAIDKIIHASILNQDYRENFIQGDMFSDKKLWKEGMNYDLLIVMPGRFLDVSHDKSSELLKLISSKCKHILVYAYDDVLSGYSGLKELAENAGFEILSAHSQNVALAKVRQN